MKIIMQLSLAMGILIQNNALYPMSQPSSYQALFHCDSCQMLYAASTGDLALIEELVTNSTNVEAQCPNFTTSKTEEFEEIFGYETEAFVNREIGDTLLHTAVRHGQKAAIDLLLAKHADIFAINRKNKTVLHLTQDPAILQSLVKAIKQHFLPLAPALHPRLRESSSTLTLESFHAAYQPIINAKDTEGCTPICQAAKTGAASMITILLQAGADADAADNKGITPLHYAAGRCDPEAIEIATQLVAHGAHITASADGMRNALFFARNNGDSEKKMLDYLESQVQ